MEKARVLLIEDENRNGILFKEILQSQGHQVIWIAGAENISTEGKITGYRTPTHLFTQPQPVEINLLEIDVALVDGVLMGHYNGAIIIPHLVRANIVCLGISSSDKNNSYMKEAGAVMAIDKDLVSNILHKKDLDLDEVLALYRPSALNL